MFKGLPDNWEQNQLLELVKADLVHVQGRQQYAALAAPIPAAACPLAFERRCPLSVERVVASMEGHASPRVGLVLRLGSPQHWEWPDVLRRGLPLNVSDAAVGRLGFILNHRHEQDDVLLSIQGKKNGDFHICFVVNPLLRLWWAYADSRQQASAA